jgi:putative ABC transport system permease protein
MVVIILLVLFKTEKGILIRFAREDSRMYLESIGVNQKTYLLLGMGLANSLAALSGSLVAFQEGSASVTMGFGMILVALVSLVIGEQIIRAFHKDLTDLWPTVLASFIGSSVYFLIIRFVRGLNSLWQVYRGFPDPTDQFQYFNTDIRVLSVIIMVILYLFRKREITEINIPERL